MSLGRYALGGATMGLEAPGAWAAPSAGAAPPAGWVLEEPNRSWVRSLLLLPLLVVGEAAGAPTSGKKVGIGTLANRRFTSSSGCHTIVWAACLGAATCAGFTAAAGAGAAAGGSDGGGGFAAAAFAGAAAGFGAAARGARDGGGGVGVEGAAGGAAAAFSAGITCCTCAIGAWSSALKLLMKVSTVALGAAAGGGATGGASGGKGFWGGFGAAWGVIIMRSSASTSPPGMATGSASVHRAGRMVDHSQGCRGR